MSSRKLDNELKEACRVGDYYKVINLLSDGARIEVDNHYPLRTAVVNEHKSIVEELLKAGADPKANDSEALIKAAEVGSKALVKLLLEAGADPKACDSEAIVRASARKYFHIVRELLHLSEVSAVRKIVQNSTDEELTLIFGESNNLDIIRALYG